MITPPGRTASTPFEAASIAHFLGGSCVVKALIPIGGRGMAGGVRVCQSADQAHRTAASLLGSDLLGYGVNKLLVEEMVTFSTEIYTRLVTNTASNNIDLILSLAGGVDIENAAREDQLKIHHLSTAPGDLLPAHRTSSWLHQNKIDLTDFPTLPHTLASHHRAAADLDAILLEINPLAVHKDIRLIALDAKLEVDDNALPWHPELNELFVASLSTRELRARQLGVSYVPLDGNIGVITSGVGLGMATLDLRQQRGLSPANFLATGGEISEHMVRGAVDLILESTQVRGTKINLYGGINNMLEAAKGICAALGKATDNRPIIVKIIGNQQEESWAMLERLPNVHVVPVVQTEAVVDRLAMILNMN